MTVACVIPARFNSSRFPGKLLMQAAGKSVLQRTFERASQCPDISLLYVATDDERIAEHVQNFGGEIIWTSPDCKHGTERVAQAIRSHKELQNASIVVNPQGDHPCVEPATMSALIRALQSDEKAVVSTPVTQIRREEDYLSPHVVKAVFDQALRALYFSRAPIPFSWGTEGAKRAFAHIGIYCYRTDFLLSSIAFAPSALQSAENLEQLAILELGHRIKIAIVNEPLVGIDTPQDLVKLENYLCQSNIFS
jgi:3-deoxy-manno-octulosonate cytidylyltransferase (CMP-KDO synthetase)